MSTDKKSSQQTKYLNLDFDEFKKDLKEAAKIYFPKTSKDMSEASSAMMMIENAAYIGEVLSFYIEDRFKNSNIHTAKDIDAIFTQARALGYPLRGPSAASGEQSFYLEVPAITGSYGGYIPDLSYALNFKNVQLQNSKGIVFETSDEVNFTKVNISSSSESRISRRDSGGYPTHFILKRKADVFAGKTVTEIVSVGAYKPWLQVEISEQNVIEVISVQDSGGGNNRWFEVDYAAQEAIFEGIQNLSSDSDDVEYSLKLKTVPKRFVRTINPKTGKTTLTFGPGKATEIGSPFVADPADIAIDLRGKLNFTPTSIDPQNFLKTRTLGLSPINTTLTIKCRVGGGIITNTAVNGLRDVIGKEYDLNGVNLDTTELNNTLGSFSTTNEEPLVNGLEAETPEEIKQNAAAYHAAQGRLVTKEDYIARCLSLPTKFGKVFRAYATISNEKQGGVQVYIIVLNHLGQLSSPSDTLSKNLKTYLGQFARMGQGIDILSGKIINIGVEYTVVVASGHNKTKVKLDTLKKVKDFFNIRNWQLNQPIIIDDIRMLIKNTEGVVSISDINIVNRNNIVNENTYSSEIYDIKGNTKNGIVFARQNGIFELKYPNSIDLKVGSI